jgi:monoterpene epsilon-lactone hydrolase
VASIRHAVVAAYIRQFRRRRPGQSDDEVAASILDKRHKERFAPPKSLGPRVSAREHSGFDVYTLQPPESTTRLRVLYLHGGAYVADLTPQHWQAIDHLSRTAQAEFVVPRYPLAPEADWTTSRDGLISLATRMLAESHTVAIMGDSAGGGLALALTQHLSAAGLHPAGLVLLSPWVDLTVDEEHGRVTNDPWLDPTVLRGYGRLWAAGDPPTAPWLSPINGSMVGLPHTLISAGTRDILYPGINALVARMREAKVEVELTEGKDLIHVYPLLPVPEAKPARAAITDYLLRTADEPSTARQHNVSRRKRRSSHGEPTQDEGKIRGTD